jgi:hypothetical protein
VWPAEIGFTTESTYIADAYRRFLPFALGNDPGADRYKIFIFAAWSPDDPKAYGFGRTLLSGKSLSAHGRCLRTLCDLLVSGPLALRAGVTCTPSLTAELDEHRSALEAFTVGDKRVVLAFHLAGQADTTPAGSPQRPEGSPPPAAGTADLNLSIAGLSPAAIDRIERVGATGKRTDLMAHVAPTAGGIKVSVPRRDTAADDVVGDHGRLDFYVAISLLPPASAP